MIHPWVVATAKAGIPIPKGNPSVAAEVEEEEEEEETNGAATGRAAEPPTGTTTPRSWEDEWMMAEPLSGMPSRNKVVLLVEDLPVSTQPYITYLTWELMWLLIQALPIGKICQ
jgi:hypothetical protein